MTNAAFTALINSLLERVVTFGDPRELGSARAPRSNFLITDGAREHLLAQAIRGFKPFSSGPLRDDGMPSASFVAVKVKPGWSEKDLATAILQELRYATNDRMSGSVRMTLVRQAVASRGVRVLHLISAHNLVGLDPRQRHGVMFLLKSLAADWGNPVRLIFSGQPSLRELLVGDPQLKHRSNVIDLTTNFVHFD